MKFVDESHFIEKSISVEKTFTGGLSFACITFFATIFLSKYPYPQAIYQGIKLTFLLWGLVISLVLISIPIYKILLYFRKDSYIYSIDEYDPGLKVELLNEEKLDLEYKNLVWVRETLPGKIRLWDQVSNRQFVFTNKLTDENGKTTMEVEGKQVGIFKHVAQEIVDRLEGKQI